MVRSEYAIMYTDTMRATIAAGERLNVLVTIPGWLSCRTGSPVILAAADVKGSKSESTMSTPASRSSRAIFCRARCGKRKSDAFTAIVAI